MKRHLSYVDCCTDPNDTPFEDWLDGDYWRRFASTAHIGDIIEVRNESLTRWAELIVVACEPHVDLIELRIASRTRTRTRSCRY